MKKGFTLAEVLITLAIIGVVAALTIPSVIVKTQQQEFKTAAKKAHSVLSQAVQLTEVKDGYGFNDGIIFVQALMNNMNISKVEKAPGSTGGYALPSTSPMLPYPGAAVAAVLPPEEMPDITQMSFAVFYTADGIRYHMVMMGDFGLWMIVDVNGDKGPTKFNTNVAVSNGSYAKCMNGNCSDDDLADSEWKNIKLSDLFYIIFNNNPTASIVYPAVEGLYL